MIITKHLETCIECPVCHIFHEWGKRSGGSLYIQCRDGLSDKRHFYACIDEDGIIDCAITIEPFSITIENELEHSFLIIRDDRLVIERYSRVVFDKENVFEQENNPLYNLYNETEFDEDWKTRVSEVVDRLPRDDEIDIMALLPND